MRKGSQSKSKKSAGKSANSSQRAEHSPNRRLASTVPISPRRRPPWEWEQLRLIERPVDSPPRFDSFMLNNPKTLSALRARVAQVHNAPRKLVAKVLSTPSTRTFAKTKELWDCVGRKVRRELVFASGGVGKGRTYPNRRSPSKEKC